MRDQDAKLFPSEYGKHGTLDTCGDESTPDRPIGPLERRFYNVPILMFFKEVAKKTSDTTLELYQLRN